MGASVAALVALAAPALAQTGGAPGAADQSGAAPIVIVTAEKRSANIQTVPIAVTAFQSHQRDIEGISTIQDMTDFTPGLTYSSQLDRPAMRGLSRNNNIYTSDSAVAVYDNDAFSNSTFLAGRDDMFVDQVEVLLGPQGTLYGRNSIGGLINVQSTRPTNGWTGEIRETYGSYDYNKIEGTVSGPLPFVDGLKFRLSAFDINQNQGYFKNLTGLNSTGDVRHDPYVELQLQYDAPQDSVWAYWYDIGFNADRGGPGSLIGTPTTGPYEGALVGLGELSYNPNFGWNPGVGANGVTLTPVPAGPGNPAFLSGTANGPVAGSVVGLIPGFTNNPTDANIRQTALSELTSIYVNAAFTYNLHWIHHFDGFDTKYVGAYSQYHYALTTNNFLNGESSITQYQIPIAPLAAGGECATLNFLHAIGSPFGVPCGPLTVDPSSRFTYDTQTDWWSNEITFTSTTKGPLQWIGGLYQYQETDNNPETAYDPHQAQLANPLFIPGLGVGPAANPHHYLFDLDYQDDIQSYGVYGQLDYKITPTIKLTGGLRWSDDIKSVTEEARFVAFGDLFGNCIGFTSAAPCDAVASGLGGLNAENLGSLLPAVDITALETNPSGQPAGVAGLAKGVTCLGHPGAGAFAGFAVRCLGDTSSAVTGTAGIEWTPDSQTLAYLRYNRGYKAFSLNSGFVGTRPEAAPEYVDDFEAGVKKTFDRTFTVDADVFYYNYTESQIPIGVNVGSLIVTEFVNIPQSISTGFELTTAWQPIEHLNLSLVYGYDFTQIQSGCSLGAGGVATGTCFVDATDPKAIAPGAHPVGATGLQSVKGEELPQAPANKVGFNANYTFVFDPGNLTLSGSFVWKDTSYSAIFNRFYYQAPSWDQVDLRATWSGDHDHYEIILYVKNVFNSLGYDAAAAGGIVEKPVGGGAQTWDTSYDLTPPRLFGVELHYKFF
jgi:iron complex outermembrane receptor protein